MLSARLYEDKIVMIDSEAIDYAKTSYLDKILLPYKGDHLTFLTPFDVDPNFLRASKNLRHINIRNP